MKDKNALLQETIVQITASIYPQVYEKCECFTEASAEIIRLAKKFEDELNWQDDDERDYLDELDKFCNKYLEEIITESNPARTFSKDKFNISALSRDDLESIGFDASDVDDDTMERLADKLGEDYCEQLFWTSLEIIAEEGFSIPRKESEKDEEG